MLRGPDQLAPRAASWTALSHSIAWVNSDTSLFRPITSHKLIQVRGPYTNRHVRHLPLLGYNNCI